MQKPSANDAFRRIYDEHYPAVLSFCLRRVPLEDAKDASAEVFLVAWRRLDDVPGADGSLPWLYGTARRVLANQRRGQSRRYRLATRLRTNSPAATEGPETVVVRRERDREVLDALGRLRPSDREVIQLSLWENMSHAAIGEVLGCSDRAVTMRLHRALKRLDKEYPSHHRSAIAPAFAPDTEAPSD